MSRHITHTEQVGGSPFEFDIGTFLHTNNIVSRPVSVGDIVPPNINHNCRLHHSLGASSEPNAQRIAAKSTRNPFDNVPAAQS